VASGCQALPASPVSLFTQEKYFQVQPLGKGGRYQRAWTENDDVSTYTGEIALESCEVKATLVTLS
jgi:hypothetical protein